MKHFPILTALLLAPLAAVHAARPIPPIPPPALCTDYDPDKD